MKALRPVPAQLPALLAELARVTKKGIFLDPVDVATMGTAAPPDGLCLSAEMVLRTVEEMIAKIESGKTYATQHHPEAWTRAMLRNRLRGFFAQKSQDVDVQEREATHEEERRHADEELVRSLREAAERRAIEEADDSTAQPADDVPADGKESAPPLAPERRLILARTGDDVFDEAVHHTRALSAITFDGAFTLVQFDGLADGVLSLRFTNEFAGDFVKDKFLPVLTAKITERIGQPVRIETSVDANLSRPLMRWTEAPVERGLPA